MGQPQYVFEKFEVRYCGATTVPVEMEFKFKCEVVMLLRIEWNKRKAGCVFGM
jgi:hypothetical protein